MIFLLSAQKTIMLLSMYSARELEEILAKPHLHEYDTKTLAAMRERLETLHAADQPPLHESVGNPLMAS
jgi:hypothetical protein